MSPHECENVEVRRASRGLWACLEYRRLLKSGVQYQGRGARFATGRRVKMHRAEGDAAERAKNEFSVTSNAADKGEGRAPGTSHISVNNPRASEFRSGYSVERIHGHRNSNIPRKDERNKHWKTKHRRGEIVAKRGSISVAYFLSYNMLFGKEMFRIVGNALQYEDMGTDPEVTSSSSSLQPDFDMNTEKLWDLKTAESRDDEGFEKVWHRFATWTDQGQ
ncbi:hypothetical protein B0H13DRAFT_1876052 [Mycena leptocephala]|nr:hypothetical protein B0H13DRAFT_1876052 [Mycena leptocephala]